MPPSPNTPMTRERTWDADGIPVLRANISLPAPEGQDKASRRIRKFYRLQSDAFLRYCENFLLPRAKAARDAAANAGTLLPCWEAELTYRVTFDRDGLWSLYTQSRELTDETLLIRRGDTWDLSEAVPVPLTRFLRRPLRWRGFLYPTACAQLEQRSRAGAIHLHQDWRQRLKKALNPRDYYLTEEGIVFFLPMHSVSEDIPTFTIPWRKTAP